MLPAASGAETTSTPSGVTDAVICSVMPFSIVSVKGADLSPVTSDAAGADGDVPVVVGVRETALPLCCSVKVP